MNIVILFFGFALFGLSVRAMIILNERTITNNYPVKVVVTIIATPAIVVTVPLLFLAEGASILLEALEMLLRGED